MSTARASTTAAENVAARRDRTERACGAQHGANASGGPSGPAPRTLPPEKLAAEQLAAEHATTHPLSAQVAHEAAALLAAAT